MPNGVQLFLSPRGRLLPFSPDGAGSGQVSFPTSQGIFPLWAALLQFSPSPDGGLSTLRIFPIIPAIFLCSPQGGRPFVKGGLFFLFSLFRFGERPFCPLSHFKVPPLPLRFVGSFLPRISDSPFFSLLAPWDGLSFFFPLTEPNNPDDPPLVFLFFCFQPTRTSPPSSETNGSFFPPPETLSPPPDMSFGLPPCVGQNLPPPLFDSRPRSPLPLTVFFSCGRILRREGFWAVFVFFFSIRECVRSFPSIGPTREGGFRLPFFRAGLF